jgi:hypothetical protein
MKINMIYTVVAVCLTCTISFAQNEIYGPYKNWEFGGYRLTFENQDSVTSSQNGTNSLEPYFRSYESTATVSDENGNFLFYTNGRSVFNKDMNYIPGGNNTLKAGNEGVNFCSSSTQGSMIVKHPESDLYYIFTVGDVLSNHRDGIQYVTVDMSANDGAGQVSSSIYIGKTASEALTAGIHSNGKDIWIVTHLETADGPRIGSFLLTRESINTNPVISQVDSIIGIHPDAARCSMKFNNEGSKLISFSPYDFGYKIGGILFFDFNNTTGLITKKRNITKMLSSSEYFEFYFGYNGFCHPDFSPEENYIYYRGTKLCRIKISDWENTDSIVNSFEKIENTFTGHNLGGLKFGPNNRLYHIQGGISEYKGNWDNEDLTVTKTNAYQARYSNSTPNMFIPKLNFSVATEKKLKNKSLAVFPNPFNDSFTINTQEKNYSGTVISSLGQPVLQFEYPVKQINTSTLESGIYYVQFQSQEDSYTLPIVKR